MATKKDKPEDAKDVEKVASETPVKAASAKKTSTAAKATTAKKATTSAKPAAAAKKPATAAKATPTAKKPAAAAKATTAKKATTSAKPAAAAKKPASTTKKPATAAKAKTVKKTEEAVQAEPVTAVEEVAPVIPVEEAAPVAPAETVAPVVPEKEVEAVAPVVAAEEIAQAPEASLPATAEANEEKTSKPSFAQKTKSVFVNAGHKIKTPFVNAASTVKGWFVKEKPVAAEQTGDGGAAVAVSDEMKTILAGHNLSKKERFIRFMRSQSGWAFVLPAVVLLCIFTLYPIINAFIRAFMENYTPLNKRQPYTGWGFENFVRVLKGDTGTGGANFWQCLVNTFIVTIISVPLSIVLALLIAVALNSIKAVRNAYQTILFLPYLTNALAMGAVFATFFQIIGTQAKPETAGIINDVLGWFGISPVDWLNPSKHAWGSGTVKIYWASYTAAIIYDVWAGLPFKILILFSSLQSVNKQYYDAAKIDGASKSKVLWKITAPMISPMLSYLFITGIMGGMKSYSSIVGLFGEQMGRNYNMGTVVGYIYQYTDNGQMGYAFAGSLLLFVIIMIITAISNRVSKKRVTYT